MTDPIPAPDTPQPNSGSSTDMSGPQAAGVASSQQDAQLRSLATALAAPDQTSALVMKGVVSSVFLNAAPPTISLYLSGDSSQAIDAVRFIDSYSPVVGDTVLIVKQGSELFALGQMNSITAAPSENGWVTPTLGSGVTTHGVDPVRYRVVVRDGDNVLQIRGGVTLSGTPTALWTMPTGARPAVSLLPMLIARDVAGGSCVAQLQANADGTMVLVGGTTGAQAGTSGGASTGNTGNSISFPTSGSDGQHRHYEYNDEIRAWYGSSTSGGATNRILDSTIWGGDFTDWNGTHQHTVDAHSHSMVHTHTVTAVTAPTFLSFNGVEYVL